MDRYRSTNRESHPRRPGLRRVVFLALLALLIAGPRAASAEDEAKVDRIAKVLDAAKACQDSWVRIEVGLRYDNGEEPDALGTGTPFSISRSGSEQLIRDKRPYELVGLLLDPTTVLTGDLNYNPRFVTGWKVFFGEGSVAAKPVAWAKDREALYLRLDAPLEGARPLAFEAGAKGPYYAMQHLRRDTRMGWDVMPAFGTATLRTPENGGPLAWTWSSALIIDAKGTPVGVTIQNSVPLGDAWKGSPLDWPRYDAAAMEALSAKQKQIADQGLVSVHLSFRSPRSGAGNGDFLSSFRRDKDEGDTERDVCGLLVGERDVLVLTGLSAQETARLERIQVRQAGGPAVPATFRHSLRDYEALLVQLDTPLAGGLALSERPILSYERLMLLDTRLQIRGEQRIAYRDHARLDSFTISWERQIVPRLGGAEDHYLFDADGRMVAAYIGRRSKQGDRSRWQRSRDKVLLPSVYLREVLATPAAHADPSNIPLSPEEESRLAWLGVELQNLTPELARANNVSKLTQDGRIGAIVSYVYEGSPAAKAGIELGDILVRIHAKSLPKPVAIRAGHGADLPIDQMFEHLGPQMEQFFDRMPGFVPWPSAENALNRAITEIGFGEPYEIEMVKDGKPKRLAFKVVEGPTHYHSAPTYKHEGAGLSVRDLTYEVRRFLQLAPDAPGVIISKIESGEKAAVAGLARFEVITHVNDQPIADVKAFEKALSKPGEYQLKVKRRDQERLVKITL